MEFEVVEVNRENLYKILKITEIPSYITGY